MTQPPIRIEDEHDPRIAPYRSVRERDLVGREGRFIAEGKVVLNVLFASRRFEVESVLILEQRLAGMEHTLASMKPETPLFVASQVVMDAIAGFHMHRGILALGKKRDAESADAFLANLPTTALVLALVGISNHDNVGSIFRNAAAFEADAVLLDGSSCDPLYRKAIRVSVGATLKVPYMVLPSADAIVRTLDRFDFRQLALSPGGAVSIGDVPDAQRNALYLGTEGEGLPPDLMARMQTVRIPMSREFDSLNVAAASAIALHRLWKDR